MKYCGVTGADTRFVRKITCIHGGNVGSSGLTDYRVFSS